MVSTSIEKDSIIGEVEIGASPETVFKALTDPEQLKTWWGDEKTYRASAWKVDLRVGGQWRSEGTGSSGQPFAVGGEYLEIDPPRVLAYTWKPSWIEVPPTIVRYVLTPYQGKTLLRITHSGFAGYPEAQDNHYRGWPSVLGWLKAYTDKKS